MPVSVELRAEFGGSNEARRNRNRDQPEAVPKIGLDLKAKESACSEHVVGAMGV